MKYLAKFQEGSANMRKERMPKDPFYGFKLAQKVIVKDFLSQEELDATTQKRFSTERLKITRDIFLFSC